MIRYILLTLITISTLYARENPFAPQIMESQKIITPIISIKPKTITTVEINRTKIIKKEKISPTKSIKPLTKKVSKRVKKISPTKKRSYKRVKSKLIYKGKYFKIRLKGHSIKIFTQDNMLKNFKLKMPNRLVIDFERFDVVKPYKKHIYKSKISSLKIGHHGYFYRLTFGLKKDFRYSIKKVPYGYIIKIY